MALPVCVILSIACWPASIFSTHGPPVLCRRGHFDVIRALGDVSAVRLVLFECFFERVGRLAFAFEILGEVCLDILLSTL